MVRPLKGGENINVVFARERYSRAVKLRAGYSTIAATVAGHCCCCIAIVNTSSRAYSLSETYTAICRHCVSIVEVQGPNILFGEFLNSDLALCHILSLSTINFRIIMR